MTGLLFPGTWQDRGGHAYFQDLTALAPLLSHATARSRQASTSFENRAEGRQAVTEPRLPGPLNATTRHPNPARPQLFPKSQVGGYRISRPVELASTDS